MSALNRAVAEHVMGASVKQREDQWVEAHCTESEIPIWLPIPDYEHDARECERVIEKMGETHEVMIYVDPQEKVVDISSGADVFTVYSPNWKRAVCIAALKARGVDTKEFEA